ncbi:LacI family DNA-binding transcriptional regulator [Tsukamurella tyrosinosolvens]|uniref:LacI family DNA-binding transcriptional regulator n=1 Tax=Tsukamurella tyrosinosolvens TaxID=57704 RepID=UPI0007986621|nr:LacI family DNA-binding transcriptional regulator [Tsukamurella tyrosinosolvens]KXP04660.1 LacI family transcriptional regulator [Tsukamurella tyrosinosolvens]MCA4995449.1 LacI family DNA-binding transcriptional regulator [Tsukamurella tyrosinosolvens]WEL92156.1 LacI family DNA-binding transcriptional regulator [Tsukamurella tyrosinosolvens]
MADGRPTIYDVATRAGVSKSLVSLVLQGSPRVGDVSRRAVEEAIAELGYRPSRAAADLAARRTHTVGVLIDDYTNLWFVDLVRGLHAALGPAGYRLAVVDVATADQAEDPVESMLAMRVDGLVLGMDPPRSLLARDGAALPPVVVAGTRAVRDARFDAVANDDAEGARLVARHLVGLGHRVVGQVCAGGGAGDVRREAFSAEVSRLGATVVDASWRGEASDEAGFRAATELFAADPGITAVFAANDVMAVGVLGAAREHGMDVPRDLSVVGYDDTSLASTRLVGLTTVDDRSFDVGHRAGALLCDRMGAGGGVAAPAARDRESRVLAPRLVVRGTTAPPG